MTALKESSAVRRVMAEWHPPGDEYKWSRRYFRRLESARRFQSEYPGVTLWAACRSGGWTKLQSYDW